MIVYMLRAGTRGQQYLYLSTGGVNGCPHCGGVETFYAHPQKKEVQRFLKEEIHKMPPELAKIDWRIVKKRMVDA